MDQKIINNEFSVSGQIHIDDIDYLKKQGVKTIICNRPDNEDPGQPEAEHIKQAAIEAGIEFYFMPVVSGQLTENHGEEFSDLLNSSPKPIHAYCRSGTRCSILWTLSEFIAGKDKASVLEKTAAAGYDLSKMFI